MTRAAGDLSGMVLTHFLRSGENQCPWTGSQHHRQSRSLLVRISVRGSFCSTVHLRGLRSWWSPATSGTDLDNIKIDHNL